MDFSIDTSKINMEAPVQNKSLSIKEISDFPSAQAEEIQKHLLELDKQGKLLEYFKQQYPNLGAENSLANYILKNWETDGKRIYLEWTSIEVFKENRTLVKATGIKLNEVSYGSIRYFLWKCSICQYEWTVMANTRTNSKSGCPACGGTRMIHGVNDLETFCKEHSEFNYLITEFMNEDEEGNKILPSEISRGSQKKVKWKCSNPDCEYEWTARMIDRTNKKKHGCPACGGKICIPGVNDLETFCKEHPEFKYILDEFMGEDIDGNKILPSEITKASNRDVWWHCSKCRHEWHSIVSSRTNQNSGCPECAKKKIGEAGRKKGEPLSKWCDKQGIYGEQIRKEFAGRLADGTLISIESISRGSNIKVWWHCSNKDCNHEWTATVDSRTYQKSRRGCPACAGNICIQGVNDLETYCKKLHPELNYILEEFTGLDEDNQPIKANEIAYGSHKKAKFKCKDCREEWVAAIVNRTGKLQSGCPYCCNIGTSFPEQFIFNSLRQLFPKTQNRQKDKLKNYEYDIVIPELNICIEYSGYNWHQDKLDHDMEKEQHCEENGAQFLQIYAHNGVLKVKDTYTPNQIVYKVERDKTLHIIQLQQIIKFILQEYAPNHSIQEIDFESAKNEANKVMGKA